MKEQRVGRLIQKGRRIVQGRAARASAGAALSDMQTLDAMLVRTTDALGNVETAILQLKVSRERIMAAYDRMERTPPRAKKKACRGRAAGRLRARSHRGGRRSRARLHRANRALVLGPPGPGRGCPEEGDPDRQGGRRNGHQRHAAAGIRLPEVTVNDVIADMSEGLGLSAIARKRGVPVGKIIKICRIHRIPGVNSHA